MIVEEGPNKKRKKKTMGCVSKGRKRKKPRNGPPGGKA